MAINRIDQLRNTTALPTTDDSQTGSSGRLQLYTDNLFELGSDSNLDPSQFQNQFFNDEQRQGASDRFASLTADDQQKVTEAVGSLRSAVAGVTAGTASMDDAHAAFSAALSTYKSAIQNVPAANAGAFISSAGADTAESGTAQINDILSYTVGVMENRTGSIAVDLSSKIQAKNNIRTESTELGDMLTNWPDDGSTQPFQWTSYDIDSNGNVTATPHSENLTKDQATQLNEDLQSQLNSIDDVTQMQSLDLQQKYQDQQQAMTTLSQILSSMQDTMKNTINNTKAG